MPDDTPRSGPETAPPAGAAGAATAGDGGVEDAPEGLGQETTPEILPAREPFRSLLHWLGQAEQAGGVFLTVTILVLVLAQVVQRYVPGTWPWTGEVARFAMVWTAFVMSGYLMAHDSHIAIKVVDYFLPPRVLGAVTLMGHLVVAATCAAMMYATYDFMTHDRGQVTAAAEIPLAVIYSVVALGFASTAIRAIVTILVIDLPELRSGRRVTA
jgi:TRAP-type C4-dicarboxylate transport system permease small subunit